MRLLFYVAHAWWAFSVSIPPTSQAKRRAILHREPRVGRRWSSQPHSLQHLEENSLGTNARREREGEALREAVVALLELLLVLVEDKLEHEHD